MLEITQEERRKGLSFSNSKNSAQNRIYQLEWFWDSITSKRNPIHSSSSSNEDCISVSNWVIWCMNEEVYLASGTSGMRTLKAYQNSVHFLLLLLDGEICALKQFLLRKRVLVPTAHSFACLWTLDFFFFSSVEKWDVIWGC